MHEIENKIMNLWVNPNIKENPVFEDILSKVKKLGDLVEYSSDNKNVFVISKLDDKLNRKRMTNIRISIDDNDLALIEEYVILAKPHVVIGIGCTGGQHRSVSLTNYFADHYSQKYHVHRLHRDAVH